MQSLCLCCSGLCAFLMPPRGSPQTATSPLRGLVNMPAHVTAPVWLVVRLQNGFISQIAWLTIVQVLGLAYREA